MLNEEVSRDVKDEIAKPLLRFMVQKIGKALILALQLVLMECIALIMRIYMLFLTKYLIKR